MPLKLMEPKCKIVLVAKTGGNWWIVGAKKIKLSDGAFRYGGDMYPLGDAPVVMQSRFFGLGAMPVYYFDVSSKNAKALCWPTETEVKYSAAVGQAINTEALSVVFSPAEKRRMMNIIVILSIGLAALAAIVGIMLIGGFLPIGGGGGPVPTPPRLLGLLRSLLPW